MRIHFIFLAIIFLLGIFYKKNRNNSKYKTANVILLIIFLIMTLFIGLRNIKIGTDTETYVAMFFNKNYSFTNFEIMIPIISILVHIFTSKYFIYLIILSAISLFGIYYNSKKYKFDTEYFLLLYITSFCYLYSSSAIRFFCAFSIILIAFRFMIKKETYKVILFIVIASLFHTSALIFLPVYFITKIKYNKINILILIILLSLFVLLNIFLGSNFLFGFNIFSKYTYVIDNQNSIGGLAVLMNIGILIFAFLYYKSITIYKDEYEFFVKMQLFSIAVDFIGIAHRIVWFFRFPVWFILPIVLINVKQKNKRDYYILYIVFIIIYVFLYYYYLSNSLDSHNFLNYAFNTSLN